MRVRVPPFAPQPERAKWRTWKPWEHWSGACRWRCRRRTSRRKVDERLKKLARNVRMPGFRPGKVPLKLVAQTYGPQVRIGGAGRRGAEVVQRRGEAGQPQGGGLSEDRDERRARRMPRVQRHLRGLSRGEGRRPGGRDASSGRRLEVDDAGGRQDDRDPAQAAHALRAGERAGARRRPADGRFRRERSTAQPFAGGEATDFAFVLGEGRMLPEFEAAARGMAPGEEKTLRAHLPRRLSWQGSCREKGRRSP